MNSAGYPRKFGRFGWRVDTGFTARGSAADVVRFEMDELGNDLGIPQDVIATLQAFPARSVIWVAKRKKDALRYGESPDKISFSDKAVILAEDGDEGFLVFDP